MVKVSFKQKIIEISDTRILLHLGTPSSPTLSVHLPQFMYLPVHLPTSYDYQFTYPKFTQPTSSPTHFIKLPFHIPST